MGVYVKGMEMPNDCMECPFSDYEAWCLIPGVISEHCPLVEVPTPHGRLIDEGEITAYSYLERNDEEVESLDEFPTVIEAEE